ncbi:hypothetical protein FRC17_008398 [Serendipita sp. 399]|nr:hypothetical protein FRC17_008398 [Serendipita sp. 399]
MHLTPRSYCRLTLGLRIQQPNPPLAIINRAQAIVSRNHAYRSIQTMPFHNSTPILQPVPPSRVRFKYIGFLAFSVIGGGILYARGINTEPEMREIIDSPACIPPSAKPQVYFPIHSPPDAGLLSIIATLLRRYIFSPLRTGLRFLHLVFIFSPVIITAPMLYLGVPESKHGGERWGAIWWYDMLTKRMQAAGPTFIKLAQWAASRRDLFPIELCNRLGSLHSTTKPHPLSHTISVVENVFSRPFIDVFESFDPTPIGSGAIAQVYRATLREDFLSATYLSEKRPAPSPAKLFNGTPPVDPVKTSDAEAIVSNLLQIRKNGTREQWNAELSRIQSEGYQPELVFLDAGLVTTLSDVNRRNFLELFRAIATFDGYRAGQLMISRSSSPELAIDPETFALKMQHLVLSVKAKTFSLGQIRISDVLSQVLRFVREHHVKMEGDFVNTVISVLLLEGIGRQLDPSMDLFKSALPILRQLGRQVTARDALQDGVEGNTGAMLKVWVWLEARELINAAVVNVDELIKIDWLSPNV